VRIDERYDSDRLTPSVLEMHQLGALGPRADGQHPQILKRRSAFGPGKDTHRVAHGIKLPPELPPGSVAQRGPSVRPAEPIRGRRPDGPEEALGTPSHHAAAHASIIVVPALGAVEHSVTLCCRAGTTRVGRSVIHHVACAARTEQQQGNQDRSN